jgi:hypothetical protein
VDELSFHAGAHPREVRTGVTAGEFYPMRDARHHERSTPRTTTPENSAKGVGTSDWAPAGTSTWPLTLQRPLEPNRRKVQHPLCVTTPTPNRSDKQVTRQIQPRDGPGRSLVGTRRGGPSAVLIAEHLAARPIGFWHETYRPIVTPMPESTAESRASAVIGRSSNARRARGVGHGVFPRSARP